MDEVPYRVDTGSFTNHALRSRDNQFIQTFLEYIILMSVVPGRL